MTDEGLQPPPNEPWMDKLVHKLRVENPPPNQSMPAVDWIRIAPYATFAVALAISVLGWVANKQIDQLSRTAELAAKNAADIERIDNDRASRIAATNLRLDRLEEQVRAIPLLAQEASQTKGKVESIEGRQGEAINQRQTADKEQITANGRLDTKLELLAAEVRNLNARLEAWGRNPDQNPFLRRPTWIEPPAPPILRATFSRPSHVAARKAVKKRYARRNVMLASLTRSLERAFGRPHYRGRYWSSLSR